MKYLVFGIIAIFVIVFIILIFDIIAVKMANLKALKSKVNQPNGKNPRFGMVSYFFSIDGELVHEIPVNQTEKGMVDAYLEAKNYTIKHYKNSKKSLYVGTGRIFGNHLEFEEAGRHFHIPAINVEQCN